MLGYVNISGRGRVDDLLMALADDLSARGLRIAGAVQLNGPEQPDRPCDMELILLTGHRRIRISQSLGPNSHGCRLDPQGLADAVGEVETSLATGPAPDLMIVNKFGRQEAEGSGFRTAIATALSRDVPVLIGLRDAYRPALLDWAGDMAEPVDAAQITGWCMEQITANQDGL